MSTLHRLEIFLADHEWGNELMRRVAEECLRGQSDPSYVVVQEHAGWCLSFALIEDELVCVGSANDMAVFGGRAKAFRESHRDSKIIYHDPIRRGIDAPVALAAA